MIQFNRNIIMVDQSGEPKIHYIF